MILLDTSALYALADAGDSNHGEALRILAEIEGEGEELLVHTYILLETFALLQRRHGLEAAVKVSRDTSALPTIAVDRELHDQAVDLLRHQKNGAPSLVDAVSFLVMRKEGLKDAFAFDPDFARAGFRLRGPR